MCRCAARARKLRRRVGAGLCLAVTLYSCGLFNQAFGSVEVSGTIAPAAPRSALAARSIAGSASTIAGFSVTTSSLDHKLAAEATKAAVSSDGSFAFRMDTREDAVILYLDETAELPENLVRGFVALRVDSGSAIKIPLAGATDDVVLGSLSPLDGDLVTDLGAAAIPGISESGYRRARESARIDSFYRAIKNILMNSDRRTGIWYTLSPVRAWSAAYPEAANAFVAPETLGYQGSGFVIRSNDVGRVEARAVGRGEYVLELAPPEGSVVATNDGRSVNGAAPLTSAGSAYVEHAPGLWGAKGDNFWLTNEGQGTIYMSFPAFHPLTTAPLPAGLWRLSKVSGAARTELARFDIGEAVPMYEGGIPAEYLAVPRINLGPDGRILSIEAKFYLYDKAAGSFTAAIDQETLESEIYDLEFWLQDYSGYVGEPSWIEERLDYAFAPRAPTRRAWHYGRTPRTDVVQLELLFITFKMGSNKYDYTFSWRDF